MTTEELSDLHKLAGLYRMEIDFYDGLGVHRQPGPESILAGLKSLGAPVEDVSDAPHALYLRRRELATRFAPPVVVVWGEAPAVIPLRLPVARSGERLQVRLELENGDTSTIQVRWQDLPLIENQQFDVLVLEARKLNVCEHLPFGYHVVTVETAGTKHRIQLISAPLHAYAGNEERKHWGAFLPLYSMYSERSWGIGDFSDMQTWIRWVGSAGGSFVASLPLYASFLDQPCAPSPYTPVSRLYWNELYIDPMLSDEWSACGAARGLFEGKDFQKELEQLRQTPLAEYDRLWKQKRSILKCLSTHFFETGGQQQPRFQQFLESHPGVNEYAAFRAANESYGGPWMYWPERLRNGRFDTGDFDPNVRDFFLYSQWQAHIQMGMLAGLAGEKGVGLYLDLPLGVHPDGFDAWREADVFATGVSGGAPPDAFFTSGQDWGFPPLHPEASREEGHSYFRAVVRKALKSAALTRVDHAMSLQRLYWVPKGMSAREGLYVYYPMDELMAVLVLESHRQKCVVIGEDLGTVTPEVRESLTSHRINRMYVGQFERDPWKQPPFSAPAYPVIASLNTHDTPTTAAFWSGLDIEDRKVMNLLDDEGCSREHDNRQHFRESVLQFFQQKGDWQSEEVLFEIVRKWQMYLAGSDAHYVLLNIEDLWLEEEPQNVPGTSWERPNWKRKAKRSLEQIFKDEKIRQFLEEMGRRRSPLPDAET